MGFRKQGSNSWRFECMVKGKRFTKTYKTYNETKTEVQKKFIEWKMQCDKDMFVNSVYSFKEFAEVWLKEYCRDYSPIVTKHYVFNLNNWVYPKLGSYKLQDITPMVLDNFISYLKEGTTKYKTREPKKLSNATIRKIYATVHTIITTAFQKNLINTNPCDKVKLDLKQPIKPEKVHNYDIDTYKKVLGMLQRETSDCARVVEFALKTGLRRSEIFGLNWNDIDFEKGQLSVNKTLQKVDRKMVVMPCKSRSSVRDISMPASVMILLKKYKSSHPNNFYVFSNVDYDGVTAWFRSWQREKGIERIKFHDLRHTHASLLLYQGIDIKTISERLGHSNIGITMNTYTHVMKELDTRASLAIDAI